MLGPSDFDIITCEESELEKLDTSNVVSEPQEAVMNAGKVITLSLPPLFEITPVNVDSPSFHYKIESSN